MKVLHINCNYAGRSLHQTMIDTLQTLGVESDVFVPIHARQEIVVSPRKNVYMPVCFSRWTRYLFTYKQSKIYEALIKNFNPKDYTLVHAYTLFTDGNCAYRIYKEYKIPFLVTIRNTDVNYFFKFRPDLKKRGIQILRSAKAICFLSPAYKKQVFRKYIPKTLWKELLKKTQVIPNAIDDFWHKNLYVNINYANAVERFNKKEINVLYVGGIDRNKNLLTTCAALDALREKGWDVHYTVVGKSFCPHIADAVKKRPYAKLYAPMPKEELLGVYRKNDLFVMPSFKETFGLVYVEAMSQGLPVIYTKGQGFDRQFRDGTIGYHVNANDYKGIATRIVSCVQSYERMSRKCTNAASGFRWDEICSNYIRLYQSM